MQGNDGRVFLSIRFTQITDPEVIHNAVVRWTQLGGFMADFQVSGAGYDSAN